MLFYLIHGLDTNLRAIARCRKMLQSEKAEQRNNSDEIRKAAKISIDTIHEQYAEAVRTVWVLLCINISWAIFAKLLDLFLGPIQWKHVAVLYAIQMGFTLVTKKRPIDLVIVFALLSIMPSFISGTLTRLLGSLFCFGTIGWPLVVHTWENISDRTEVRWVLIGLLLDSLYFGTAALIKQANDFGLKSIGIIVAVLIGECVILLLGVFAIVNDRPRNGFFRIISPLRQYLTCGTRLAIQVSLFYLNRFVRYLVGTLFTASSFEHLRDILYGTYYSPYDLDVLRAERFRDMLHKKIINVLDERSYVYESLKEEGTIRLLLICKGWPSEELVCKFQNYKLGGSIPYEAVSYVWGDSSSIRSIVVNHRRLPITKSAYDIIHRRRSAFLDQLIWIDQVCINQTNNEEKASQVEMMGQIYKEAVRVTAYLGHSENAHLVQHLFAELHFMKKGLRIPAGILTFPLLHWLQRRKWDAVVEFFSNPWFRRVWIIQEVAFAQELHIFYGNICMDWEYVSRAVEILLDRQMIMALRSSDQDSSKVATSNRDALIGLRNTDTMLEFHGDVNYRRKRDLALVLTECNTFGATDKRDKVFALLGLTTDDSMDIIKPNYYEENRVHKVYTDSMRFIIATTDDPMRILEAAGIGIETSIPNLPSWVPDWNIFSPYSANHIHYTAGTRYVAKIDLTLANHCMISIEGLEFDQIKTFKSVQAPDHNLDWARGYSKTARWLAEADALAAAYTKDPYREGESRSEAFIRTIVGNGGTEDSKKCLTTEQCYADYQALKKLFDAAAKMEEMDPFLKSLLPNYSVPIWLLEQPGKTMSAANRFYYFFDCMTTGRRFTVTEQGRMGILPPESLEGDIICIFNGARMPFVLRMSSKEPSVYNLVGCCYLHGVMDGEIDVQKSKPFVLA